MSYTKVPTPSTPSTSVAAMFTTDLTGGEPGVTIQFDPSTSIILNCATIPTYLWQYKNTTSGTWITFSTNVLPSFVFATAGTYDVRLTVTACEVSHTHTKAGYISVVTVAAGKFISVLGNDANPGSSTQPWQTWDHAMANVVPGQTLYVLGNDGVWNASAGPSNGNVRWTTPGTAGSPITIKPYPGHVWQMDSLGHTIPAGADTSPGGSYAPYGTKAASTFVAMFRVEASYVIIHGLEVLSSRGIGISFEGIPGTPIVSNRGYGLKAKDCYKNTIRTQYFTDLILDGLEMTTGGSDAPWNRPVTVLNHPGGTSFKNGDGLVVTNLKSWGHYGEATIIGDNQTNWDMHHCTFFDCMSPLGYINNCQNGSFHHNIIYCTTDGPFSADHSTGIYLNIEYLLPTDLNAMNNVKVYTNLVVGTGTNLRIGQGEINPGTGLLPIYNGIEVTSNTLVESAGTTSPRGMTIHNNVRTAGASIIFRYNLIHQTLPASVGTCSSDPTIIHYPNMWHGTPAGNVTGAGDVYADPKLNNPLATITTGSFNPANYQLQSGSPARGILPALEAYVTDDLTGNIRTAPHSFGCFK